MRIARKEIEKAIKPLKKKYPAKFGGQEYYVLERKEKRGKGVPFYYNPKLGKFYLTATSIKRDRRLASIVVTYRLQSLGIPYRLNTISQERIAQQVETASNTNST